jgi:hypothetical protein
VQQIAPKPGRPPAFLTRRRLAPHPGRLAHADQGAMGPQGQIEDGAAAVAKAADQQKTAQGAGDGHLGETTGPVPAHR